MIPVESGESVGRAKAEVLVIIVVGAAADGAAVEAGAETASVVHMEAGGPLKS